jgi:hypothetical protein
LPAVGNLYPDGCAVAGKSDGRLIERIRGPAGVQAASADWWAEPAADLFAQESSFAIRWRDAVPARDALNSRWQQGPLWRAGDPGAKRIQKVASCAALQPGWVDLVRGRVEVGGEVAHTHGWRHRSS